MAKISISEAARQLGVHRTTLHRWIEQGVVPKPIAEDVAGARLRYWTDADFATVKEYKRHAYWRQGSKRSNVTKTKNELWLTGRAGAANTHASLTKVHV
jgi:DNA-binding transcriptional MerR regulator